MRDSEVLLQNEIEIKWYDGKVMAGPFIGENAVWTPEQAEQFAEFLMSAAQKARGNHQLFATTTNCTPYFARTTTAQ